MNRSRAAQLLKTALDLDSIKRLKPTISPEAISTLEDTRDAILRADQLSAKFLAKAEGSSRPEMWKALSAAADRKYYGTIGGGAKRLLHHPLRYLGYADEPGDHTLKLSHVLKLALGPAGSAALGAGTGFVEGLVPGSRAAMQAVRAPVDVKDVANAARGENVLGARAAGTGGEIAGDIAGKVVRQRMPSLAQGAANVAGKVLPRLAPVLERAAPWLGRANALALPVTGAMANLKMMSKIDSSVRNSLTNPRQRSPEEIKANPQPDSMLGRAWKQKEDERAANPVDASGKRFGVFNPQTPAVPADWQTAGNNAPPIPPAKPPAFKPPAAMNAAAPGMPKPPPIPGAPSAAPKLNAPGVPSVTKPAGMTAAPPPSMTAAPMQKLNAESTFLGWLESRG